MVGGRKGGEKKQPHFVGILEGGKGRAYRTTSEFEKGGKKFSNLHQKGKGDEREKGGTFQSCAGLRMGERDDT